MFATKLHLQTTTKAEALALWCACGMGLGLRQDSSYLIPATSIKFANPEVGT